MSIRRSLSFVLATVTTCTSFAANLIDLTQEDFKRPKSAAYQLNVLQQVTDKAGNVHIRYEQTYQDIPVYGYQVLEHRYQKNFVADKSLNLKPYSGTYVESIEQDLPMGRAVLMHDPKATLMRLKAEHPGMVFANEFARTVIYIDDQNRARTAHEVNFYVDSPIGGKPSRPHYIVDADTNETLEYWEGLTTQAVQAIGTGPGGNERIGIYHYGKDYPALNVTVNQSNCSLANSTGSTAHMKNRRFGQTKAYSYSCKGNAEQNKDATNGAASPLNDAHYFIDVLTRFYRERYNTAPLPFPLVMRAHYGKNFANAFWNGSSMTYGDGDKDLYPFVVLDIAAHEIAHGVTENHSKLVYEKQSGGLNEAFSDMASRAVEYFVYGKHDWNLGGDIFKDPKILALRYMDNPTRDGRSIDHMSRYNDSLDVHLTSGIYNKAFYLLATTPGWNTADAFDMMYYANVGYWQSKSTFASAAWGVIQATAAHGRNVNDVINAFSQVGIMCDKVAAKCT